MFGGFAGSGSLFQWTVVDNGALSPQGDPLMFKQRLRYSWIAIALVLVSCSTQKEPARKLISDTDSAVNAAAPAAGQYIPDQLAEVQSDLGSLKADFDKGNYKSVLDNGQPVLSAAQALAGAAQAKKDLIARGFEDQWAALSGSIPGNASSIQSRIDFLSKKENKKLAAGVDLSEARSSLSDAEASWTKAQDAHSSGSLEPAVALAKTVQGKLTALAASMKLNFDQPAAVTDTSR
jgi:hypothetical protein